MKLNTGKGFSGIKNIFNVKYRHILPLKCPSLLDCSENEVTKINFVRIKKHINLSALKNSLKTPL